MKKYFLSLVLILVSTYSIAATYYVNTATGSDSNTPTQAQNPSTPWATIGHAVGQVAAGDTVLVANGTYVETIVENTNGTVTNRITFQSINQYGAKIAPTAGGEIISVNGSYITWQGFEIIGNSGGTNNDGIKFQSPGNGGWAIGNKIHNIGTGNCTGGAPIITAQGSSIVNANFLYNYGETGCSLYEGIYINDGNGDTVTNNLIGYAPNGTMVGIQVNGQEAVTLNFPSNENITNNTIFNVNGYGTLIACWTGTCASNNFNNNILYSAGVAQASVHTACNGGTFSSNNFENNNIYTSGSSSLCGGNTLTGTVTSNPLFVNYQPDGTGTYSLCIASGNPSGCTGASPDINAGTSTGAPATDFNGNTRSGDIWIGAFQTPSSTPTVNPTSLSFGNQIISTTSTAQNVVVTNVGMSSITLTVSISGDFAQSSSCGTLSASGGTCTIPVTFTPTVLGTRTGILTIVPSLGGTVTVPLSGTGINTPTAPTVTTTVATSITLSSAVSGGVVTSSGSSSVTSEGVCYATTPNPTTPCTSNGTATPFTSNLTGLASSTTYNYRAFATNSIGTGYGSNLTFSTTSSSGGGNTQGSGHGTGNFNIYLYTYQGFGPPLYNGSTHSTAVATLPTIPNLGTTTGVNTVVHEYASPSDFYYPSSGIGNAISRLTDSNSGCGNSYVGGTNSYFSTPTQGGNNLIFGTQSGGGYYGAITSFGGAVCYIHVHIQSITGALIVDTQPLVVMAGRSTSGLMTASRVSSTGNVFYYTNFALGTKTGVYKDTLTGTNPITINTTQLFDWNNCPGVPGNLTGQGGYGQLDVNYNDTIFTQDISFDGGGQGSALWELAYNTTTGMCAAYYTGQVLTTENPANGNIWAYCAGNCSQHGTNPAPLALNTTCAQPGFGIHGGQQIHNGTYTITSGQCNSVVNSFEFWEIGVNSIFTCNASSNNCGGHNTTGYITVYMDASNINSRPASSPTSITAFNSGIGTDFHGSEQWVGVLADINPWLVSTTLDVAGSCATQAYCYELLALRQDGTVARFANTYYDFYTGALGPISTMTQDGLYMIFDTTWGGTFGVDQNGNPRSDVLAIGPLQ